MMSREALPHVCRGEQEKRTTAQLGGGNKGQEGLKRVGKEGHGGRDRENE